MVQGNLFFLFLSYFSALMLIVPLVLSFVRVKHLSINLKLIQILLSISFIVELYSFILINFSKTSNLLVYNTFILIEGLIICYFFIKSITSNNLMKFTSLFLMLIFIIVSIYDFINNDNKIINSISITSESVIIISLSILAFFYLLKYPTTYNILSLPFFWFNTGLLIYFSGNLFLHLFSSFLQKHSLYTFYELWGLWHSLLNIIFYTLISIGFWKTKTSLQ